MTLADAWIALDAADAIARAHGYECAPVITREALQIAVRRGADFRLIVVPTADLEACADATARRELVEREVSKVFADRGAIA